MFSKILFTAVVILGVFFLARLLRDGGQKRRDSVEETARNTTKRHAKSHGIDEDTSGYEAMVQCDTCETYLPKSRLRDCGRPGCPHPDR